MKELYIATEKKTSVLTKKYKGFTYEILDHGTHPTAYVTIPKGHILDGVEYDDIEISVHGGLTYAARKGDDWEIGWDYAHSGDLYNSKYHTPLNNEKTWTCDEIETECKKVIDQILKIKNVVEGKK